MRRRLVAIGLGVAVLASATVATAAVLSSDGGTVDTSTLGSAEQTRSYYATARASLSPLIVHVRELPAALAGLAEGDAPAAGLRVRAMRWVEDCANARDLVGRIPVPPGPAGSHVGVLYQSAAMLHTEAARLAAAAAGPGSVDRRRADAVLGQRLYVLGDRMFDSAYRLLNDGGVLTRSDLRFPGAVPDFSASPTGTLAPPAIVPVGAPLGAWIETHRSDVQALVAAMGREPAGTGAAVAGDLTESQGRLGDPLQEIRAQESVTGMRLAALVLAEASTRSSSSADVTTDRLVLLAGRVWSSSAALFPDADLRSVMTLSSVAAADERVLFTGGHFNGTPPPLGPSDEPGTGLPGGLPTLDPQLLLGS